MKLSLLLAIFLITGCIQPHWSGDNFGNNPDVPSYAYIRHLGGTAWLGTDGSYLTITQSSANQIITLKKGSSVKIFDFSIIDIDLIRQKGEDYPALLFASGSEFEYQPDSYNAAITFNRQ